MESDDATPPPVLSSVIVAYGKPIVIIPYKMLKPLYCITVGLFAISIVYSLEIFSVSLHIKDSLGDYLDLFNDGHNVLSTTLIVAGALALFVNIHFIHSVHITFMENNSFHTKLLFVDVIVDLALCFVLLIIAIAGISVGTVMEIEGQDELLKHMDRYNEDGLIKAKIDKMQIALQCCGSRNYSDWYNVDWYDKNFVKKQEVSVVGEAPFSCCNIHSVFNCIHHGVESGYGSYKYSLEANFSLSVNGCFATVKERKFSIGWQVFRCIFCLIIIQITAFIPLRLIQTAHCELDGFNEEQLRYTAWIFGIYKGKAKPVPPPVPPIPLELMY